MQIPICMHEIDRQVLEHSYQYVLVEMTPTIHSSSPTSVLYWFVVKQHQKGSKKGRKQRIVTSLIHSCNNTRKDQRKKEESKRTVLSLITLVVIIDSWIYVGNTFLVSISVSSWLPLTNVWYCHRLYYSASTSWFMDLVLTYLVFLYSLGMITYSLPSLYMLQDLRSIIAGRRLLSCSMGVTIEGRS